MQIRKTVISIVTIMALGTSSYAGGKYVKPVEAEVVPIPVVINPLPLYIGIGLVVAGLSRDCPCSGDKRLKDMTYGVVGRLGWDFNQYIGIEARYLKSSLEDDFSKTTHYGLYLKPQYPITEQTNIYGLIGYGKTTVDYNNHAGRSSTLSKNGLSYGAGLEYDFGSDISQGQYDRAFDGQGDQEKGWGLWVDFQHLLYNEGVFNTDSNLVTAGVTYDF